MENQPQNEEEKPPRNKILVTRHYMYEILAGIPGLRDIKTFPEYLTAVHDQYQRLIEGAPKVHGPITVTFNAGERDARYVAFTIHREESDAEYEERVELIRKRKIASAKAAETKRARAAVAKTRENNKLRNQRLKLMTDLINEDSALAELIIKEAQKV